MKAYIGDGWEQTLNSNKLNDFDSIWDLKVGWFEKPNERRGGWSGVSKLNLKTENGKSAGVFLKRQENHNTKVWTHPFKGVPTFYREFKNILCFSVNDIPTVEPIYFAYRYKDGMSQAILMTKELDGFESLDSPTYARQSDLIQDKTQRELIMETVAAVLRKMHALGFQHNCLYGKHIFVRLVASECDVKLIDLEKLNRSFSKKTAMMRDLYTLPRHISGWRCSDRLKFLKMYRQEEKLSQQSKLIWREIHNKMLAKNKF